MSEAARSSGSDIGVANAGGAGLNGHRRGPELSKKPRQADRLSSARPSPVSRNTSVPVGRRCHDPSTCWRPFEPALPGARRDLDALLLRRHATRQQGRRRLLSKATRMQVQSHTALTALQGQFIDPHVYTCGTVPAHGIAELAHPEPGYVVVGIKSDGRAPTFLLATGYQQVRSVVAALAGDPTGALHRDLGPPAAALCAATGTCWPGPSAAGNSSRPCPQRPAGRRRRLAGRRRTGVLLPAVLACPGMSSGRQHVESGFGQGPGGAW
jgi:hypothetical protein